MGSSEICTWAAAGSRAALPTALQAGFFTHREVTSDCQYGICLSARDN